MLCNIMDVGGEVVKDNETYILKDNTSLKNVGRNIGPGDIVLIEDGVHHKVVNDTLDSLYFVCVFDGKRNH